MADASPDPTAPLATGDAGPRPRGRLTWVDDARGIAIVLVVVGHVLSGIDPGWLTGPREAEFSCLARWIYTFHMPTFFLLAGLFAPGSIRKGAGRFLTDKVATIAYPYLAWGILQTSVQAVLARYVHNPAGPREFARLLYDPPMQFWFLYVLFLAFAVYALCHAARLGGAGLLAIAVAVGLVAYGRGAAPSSIPGRFAEQVPFFALGVLLHRGAGLATRPPVPALVGIAAAGAVANTLLANVPDVPYPGRLLMALPGIAMLVATAGAIAGLGGSRPLERLGRWSLEIYLVHVLAYALARIVLKVGLGVTDPVVHLVVGSVVGVAVPAALAALVERLAIPYVFRWPSRRPTTSTVAGPGGGG